MATQTTFRVPKGVAEISRNKTYEVKDELIQVSDAEDIAVFRLDSSLKEVAAQGEPEPPKSASRNVH